MTGKNAQAKPELSAKSRITRAVVLYAFAAMVLFTARFVYHPALLKTTREQCHTGAIASDIIDHGMRLKYFEYLPERYENGIFVEGVAAIPYFLIFGRNIFALKMLGFTTSVLTMLVVLLIILMIANEKESGPGFPVTPASIVYVLLTAFAPPIFIYISVSALGDHNEGSLASALIVALYALRRRSRAPAANIALWAFSGFALFWEKGTLFPIALVALWTAGEAARRGIDEKNTAFGAAAFAAGLSPAIVASVARGGRDIMDVFLKFGTGKGERAVALTPHVFFEKFYNGVGHNPVLAVVLIAVFVAEAAWVVSVLRNRRRGGTESIFSTRGIMFAYVAGFGVIQLSLAPRELADTFQYWLVFWMALVGMTNARANVLMEKVNPKLKTILPAAILLVIVLSLNWNAIQPKKNSIERMRENTEAAVCYWRFGRGFIITNDSPNIAVERCRIFGGDASRDCISGISYWGRTYPTNFRSRAEKAAFTYGIGYQAFSPDQIDELCKDSAEGFKADCVTGALAHLAVIDFMKWNMLPGRKTPPALPCSIGRIPFGGYDRSVTDSIVTGRNEFVQLCNEGSIQSGCGLYLGACVKDESECSVLNGAAVADCRKIFNITGGN